MGPNTNSSPSENASAVEALRSIRRLVRALRTADVATERQTGLSSAQLLILQILMESDIDSVNDLAARTMTDQSSVSPVVARLEAKGLAARSPAPDDARRTRVEITDRGRALLAGAPPNLQKRLIGALRERPAAALQTLAEELTRLTAALDGSRAPHTFFFENDATGSIA